MTFKRIMKNNFWLLFVSLFLGLTFQVSAQSFRYEGKVVDEQHRPLSDVSVSFLRSNRSIDHFTFTDAEGKFAMALDREPSFLSLSFLGYAPQIIPIQDFTSGKAIQLLPADFKLQEVKVKSNRVSIQSDTLSYLVSGFRMPQDRSIADVLKKMPGLEVLPNGTIRFEDKNISKLYIEGMDLMGNNYALATNNLSGKAVKKVEILRNHQQIAALRGKNFSEQAAINLVLEDEVRFALSGSLEGGGGVNDSRNGLWDLRALSLYFGRKHQNLSLYKTNNIGMPVAEELQPQIRDLKLSLSETDPLIQLPRIDGNLIDEKHYLDNRDHLVATHHLYRLNPESQLRTQFHYLHSDQKQDNETTTQYFYPDQTVIYREQNTIEGSSDQLKGEVTFERNAHRSFIKNILDGSWKKSQADQHFHMNQEPMYQRLGNTRRQLSNRLQLVLPLNEKHLFKLISLNRIEEMPQQLTVTPGIFPELLNQGSAYTSFQQHVKIITGTTRNTTDWQFKLFRFYVGTRLGIDYTQERLTSGICGTGTKEGFASNADFTNHLTFGDLRLHASPHLQYQKGGFRMNLSVPISLHRYRLKDQSAEKRDQRFTRTFVEPALQVNYEMNAFWSLLPTVMYRYQTPSIQQLYTQYLFTQYREASKGTSFETFGQLITTLTLKFNNPMNGWFWSLTGNLIRGDHDQVAKTLQQNGLHATEMVDYPHHTLQWTCRTRLSKTFAFWKTFVGLTAQYLENRRKLMLEEEVVPYQTQSVTVSGNYALQPNRYLSIEGTERFNHTTLSSGILPDSYAIHLNNRIDVNVFPSPHWKFQWSHAWYLNYKPTHSSIYFMNGSLTYTAQPYSIELVANNILNKRMYLQNTLHALTERTVNQQFRPREFLVKVSCLF